MADSPRPDPDALLAQVKAQEAAARRGRLHIFFGAAAGVGKTYAMLAAARERACEGVDVVVGYAEPHNRPETEALILGLEVLPQRQVEYRGALLREFDLDAALARKPELILVDELAHTNAPGSRHAKRWQDVRELLDAGMDVYTTLNVQHLESQCEAVAAATGIMVQETLPDAVFDAADEVELIDLPPDELLDRLRGGKIYEPHQAELALVGFFKKSNLSTLRELSMRKTADRISDQTLSARRLENSGVLPRAVLGGRERLIAGVTADASAARVVRAAKRMATALHAPWTVAFVETPEFKDAGPEAKEDLQRALSLAERQGARVLTVPGLDPAEELLALARSEGATCAVVGRPAHQPFWRSFFRRNMVQRLADGGIEVHTVVVDPPKIRLRAPRTDAWLPTLRETVLALAAIGSCAGISAGLMRLFPHFALANIIMIHLAGVALVAARAGRGQATAAAVLSVLVFDFFFVEPRFTFAVADGQYVVTFVVMLGVALLIATQTHRIRAQADASRRRERHTDALLRMTTEMAGCSGLKPVLDTAAAQLAVVFRCPVDILLAEGEGLVLRATSELRGPPNAAEMAVARWVRQNGRPAGRGTDTLPGAQALFVPLLASGRVVGVAGFHGEHADDLLDPDVRPHLDAMTGQVAQSVERAQLAAIAREEAARAESERLRGTLLSSVSHDLRTPLSVIIGDSERLMDGPEQAVDERRALAAGIHAEAVRLDRLVGNLLDITRLETGAVSPRRETLPVEEIIGATLARPIPEFRGREVFTEVPDALPMVGVDAVLAGQALLHLLENAARYSPPGMPIIVRAQLEEGWVAIHVLDRGPGLKPGEAEKIFDKFFRGVSATGKPGTGLGLAICRAIVEAHGGRVLAANREGGGADFIIRLPVAKEHP